MITLACMIGMVLLGGTAPDAPQPPHKVLYFVHSAGYYHEIIPFSAGKMMEWAKNNGGYEVDVTKDCTLINADFLKRYDALVFYSNRELPMAEEQRQAILDFVKAGKGFTAVHCGTGTFFEWPPYQDMVNGLFDGHPWSQKVGINIEQPDHPIMKGAPKTFEVNDEIYQHKRWERSRTHVLASLDVNTVDLKAKGVNRTDKDFGIAWAHRYGKGRVYVNVLGHTKEVWESPVFERMMVQGILWTMGELPLELPDNADTGK